jgi:predicted metal-dependent enzyme (double-stranded beta helix superfamily)
MTTAELRDRYYIDSPVLRTFIAEAQRIVGDEPERAQTVRRLRPAFADLLGDQTWLPEEFRRPDTSGGMGGGIGNYLLFRSAHRDLTVMSLVLPPGAGTPVHDHLAWGLVGLYGGEQDEWVYRRLDPGDDEGAAELAEVERRHLYPGDFYELLPPEGDIHRVTTAGDWPSISIHLLGNDIGCVWRHRYEPQEHRVYRFRSSYSNEPCEQTAD